MVVGGVCEGVDGRDVWISGRGGELFGVMG
jgi:hypothetical protein